MAGGLSLIISAYQSQLFIDECLASVYASLSRLDEPWELLIGIDGCPDTRRAVRKYPLGSASAVHYFPDNVGTYVVTNTMISLAAYDGVVRFDSDDVMLPAFASYLSNRKPARAIMRFPYHNFTQPPGGDRIIQDSVPVSFTCGIVCLSPGVLDELGGYRPWRCTADADLLHRAEMAGVSIDQPDPVFGPAMLRRRHEGSLTGQFKTGISSALRNRHWAETRETTDPYVKPTVAPCLRIR